MNILEGLIPGEDAPKPADANHLSKLFVFSLMWSVGALLELDDRKKVFLRWAWFASILLWRTFYYLYIYLIYLYAEHVRLTSPTSWAQRFSFNSENCTPHPPLCHQTWRGQWSISPGPMNRLFPSFPGPLYQNEVNCSVFNTEMIFHRMQINSFSKERLCTRPHFESEGFWNSEVPYCKMRLGAAKQSRAKFLV